MAEKLDRLLQDVVADGDMTIDKVLGMAFIVQDKEGIIYSGASGRIDFDTNSASFTDHAFQNIASMSKLFTTIAALKLVDMGKWTLEDDMRPLVPCLKMPILRGFDKHDNPILQENTRPITLRHLLTHTSGLVYPLFDSDIIKWAIHVGHDMKVMPITEEDWSTPLKHAPGEYWEYGLGVDVAGLAIEAATGMPLGEFCDREIFQPLEMHDTTFRPLKVLARTKGRWSIPAYRDPQTRGLVPGPQFLPLDPPMDYGGAGAYTTAWDYNKVLRELLLGGGKLLSKEMVDEMFRPQTNDQQRIALQDYLAEGYTMSDPPEYQPGMRFDHGLAGIINLDDSIRKRKKGSLRWGGAVNSVWWIDRETGISVLMFMHVFPAREMVPVRLLHYLEEAVYMDLLPSREREGGVKA